MDQAWLDLNWFQQDAGLMQKRWHNKASKAERGGAAYLRIALPHDQD